MDYDQEEENGTFTLRIKSRSDEHEGTQKKTFTKWINAQLAKVLRSEKGQTRVHFMTNVDNALRILEQNNVRPVNISNDDIVDGNPKLTLGLMWYIISHFQLQLLFKNLMLDSDSGTPEEKLLAWCRQSVRGYDAVEVRNFTTSWRDGLAFNALIHRYRPHLFDYSDQLEKKSVECCEHAFTVAEQYLDVERLLDPEGEMHLNGLRMLSIRHLFYKVERSLEAERPDSFVSETSSVRDSVGSFKEWEDYTTTLHEVLNWLSQAERTLESQERISDNVDAVKKQFHGHEDFMMELTSHQSEVGAVLEFGNQMISEGLVNDKEESEIREQMISLNDRWEGLRMAAMDRQTKYALASRNARTWMHSQFC
ncbi:PREDICTED: dystrophin-like [Acropora digitifera]|uniref:dystrophin-like n=1 Tax=Acropora digitifera TaxID=70779 RepID=UPI00077AE3EA|nr:PREDICTED: dystrophin-like [Acropora digitifera]